MVLSQPSNQYDIYSRLPKIELHRHLEGSIRLNTLIEISGEEFKSEKNRIELASQVQIGKLDPLTAENFLSKFYVLRNFFRSKEIIQQIVYEAISDAASENILYLELRFSPTALCQQQKFKPEEVIDWVIQSTAEVAADKGIKTRLISTVNRHEGVQNAETIASLSAERINDGLVGLDLAGNEADYEIMPFAPVFNRAAKNGLKITVHAGEWSNAENIRLALSELHAQRIGHGVCILDSPETVRIARELHTIFEVCPTSNYQSGVVKNIQQHPFLSMVENGLQVTLNTDDPSISSIDLSHEYRLAVETLELPFTALPARILTAARGSFLPDAEKQNLVNQIRQELSSITETQQCIF